MRALLAKLTQGTNHSIGMSARAAAGGGVFPSTALPLTCALYVDKGRAVPPAQQNGSIVFPFSTIQAAIGVGIAVLIISWGMQK